MAGRRYALAGTDTNTAATTQVGLVQPTAASGVAVLRAQIYDLMVSSVATPADNAGEYFIQRITTAGTSTAVTPAALNSGDPVANTVCGQNYTAEPTYTANTVCLRFATNQRATFRWVAAPESELVGPATTANGFGLLANAIGGAAVAMAYTILFAE
jgi:hypothetical protein